MSKEIVPRLRLRGNNAVIYSDALIKGSATVCDIRNFFDLCLGTCCKPEIDVRNRFANLVLSDNELCNAVELLGKKQIDIACTLPDESIYKHNAIKHKIGDFSRFNTQDELSDVSRETYLNCRKMSNNGILNAETKCLLTILLYVLLRREKVSEYVCDIINRGFNIAVQNSLPELTDSELTALKTIADFTK